MGKLNTDFKDDILSEKMNGKKRVKLIPQEDGTYILEDVTEYTQVGSSYGQKEINLLNSTVNGKLDSEKVIDDLGTALAVTEEGVPVGCKAISALNSNLGNCTFSVQSDGAYVTYTPEGGADTVTKKLGGRADHVEISFNGRAVITSDMRWTYTVPVKSDISYAAVKTISIIATYLSAQHVSTSTLDTLSFADDAVTMSGICTLRNPSLGQSVTLSYVDVSGTLVAFM